MANARRQLCLGAILFACVLAFPMAPPSHAESDGPYAEAQELPINDAIRVLRESAAALKANYEVIQTFQGTYSIKDTRSFAGDKARFLPFVPADARVDGVVIDLYETASVTFASDFYGGKCYSSYAVDTKPKVTITGTVDFAAGEIMPFVQRTVLTREEFLNFRPNEAYGPNSPEQVLVSDGAFGRMAFRNHPEEAEPGLWGPFVDPRKMFLDNEPPWEELDRVAQLMEEGTVAGPELQAEGQQRRVVEAEEGGVPCYVVVLSGHIGEDSLVSEIAIAVEQPRVLSRRFRSGGKLSQEANFTYTQDEGLWIPERMERKLLDADGRVGFHRVFERISAKVNHPLDPELFTYESLGLQNGDRLLDKIEGVEYTYDQGELRRATGKPRLKKLIEDVGRTVSITAALPPEVGQTIHRDAASSRPSLESQKVRYRRLKIGFITTGAVLLLAAAVAVIIARRRYLDLGAE